MTENSTTVPHNSVDFFHTETTHFPRFLDILTLIETDQSDPPSTIIQLLSYPKELRALSISPIFFLPLKGNNTYCISSDLSIYTLQEET